jgi:hypothetical protein
LDNPDSVRFRVALKKAFDWLASHEKLGRGSYQAEFARLCSVDVKTLRRWLSGETIPQTDRWETAQARLATARLDAGLLAALERAYRAASEANWVDTELPGEPETPIPVPDNDVGSSGDEPSPPNPTDTTQTREQMAFVRSIKTEIELCLSTSNEACEALGGFLKVDPPVSSKGSFAAAIAEKMVSPQISSDAALAATRRSHKALKNSRAVAAIKQVVRQYVRLMFDESEVDAFRSTLESGTGLFLRVPVGTMAGLEIFLSRTDGRPPEYFEANDPNDYPRGVNLLPTHAELGPEQGDFDFVNAFERHLMAKCLSSIDLAKNNRERAKQHLETRLPDTEGRLYFIYVFEGSYAERKIFEKQVEYLKHEWKSVLFLETTEDDNPQREIDWLWAIREMLPKRDDE